MLSLMNFRLLIVFLVWWCVENESLGDPPNGASLTSDGQHLQEEVAAIEIPFALTSANILSVRGILNGTDTADLMFHTAVDSLSLTKESIKRISSVKMDDVETIKSWGGESQGRFSKSNSLKLAGLTWDNLLITEDELSGSHTDGKFGPNLFKGYVIEVDFEHQSLRLHSRLPDTIDPKYQRLAIEYDRGNMFVLAAVETEAKRFENRFLLHTGFGGTVVMDDEFVASNGLAQELKTVGESQLSDALGNVLKTKDVQIPSFSIAAFRFSDVPSRFFDGSSRLQRISVLGVEILKRFNWIIDKEHDCIYLKPNSLFNSAFSG